MILVYILEQKMQKPEGKLLQQKKEEEKES